MSTVSAAARGIIFLMLGHNMFWMSWRVDWIYFVYVLTFSIFYR